MRCGARSARDCLIDHISRSVVNARPGTPEPGARPTDAPRSIRADCPVCGRDSLTISLGGFRDLTWICHAGCDLEKIRLGLIHGGCNEDCLPPLRPDAPKKAKPRTDAEIVRELRSMLDSPDNGNAYRLKAAMLLWGLDAVAAADRLGIPERTRRRLLCP